MRYICRPPSPGTGRWLAAAVLGLVLMPLLAPGVRAQEAAAGLEGQPVVEIEVHGLETLPEETLLYYLDLEPGRLLDLDSLNSRIKNLWDRQLVEDLRVRAEPVEGGVKLILDVVERPVLLSIDYQGLKKISRNDIRDKIVEERIVVREGGPLSRGELERLRAAIGELYSNKGYRFAEVSYQLEPVAGDENQVRAVFTIDEGDRVRIGDVDFEGNTVYSDLRLQWAMRNTKETNLINRLLRKDIYNPAKLEEDLEKVRELYRKAGYKNVLLGDPGLDVRERGDKRRMQLTIPIEEGERYRFGEITIDGNEVYSDQALLRVFRNKPGTWLKADLIDEGLESVRELYANTGYMFARVDPELRERDDNVADVVIHIDEGEQFQVGRIEFEGNSRTMDKVLRRELRVQEGYVMNVAALRNSVYKINQLGYFQLNEEEPVKIDVNPEDKTVDLVFDGEEADRTELQFGGGWSEFDGFFGTFSIRTQNFLGRGESLQAAVQTGRRQDLYNLGYFIPWFLDRPQTIGIQAFSQTLDYNTFIGSGSDDYERSSEGGTLTYGRSFRLFQSFAVSYTLASFEERFQLLPEQEGGEPRFLTSKIDSSSMRPVWSYNSIDNRFEPTRGLRLSLSGEYSGGFLGGQNNFFKPELRFTLYKPLGSYPVRNVFAVNVEGGFLEPFDEGIASIFEYFRLGGERSIRGHSTYSVLPRREDGTLFRDPRGAALGGDRFLQANLEYHLLAGGPFRFLIWTDAGQTWAEEQDLDFAEVRWTAGLELRVLVPVFGAPLRFIYAFNLDEKPYDQFEDFQFSIGSTF
jgi:outer membrane protein insertion porin family